MDIVGFVRKNGHVLSVKLGFFLNSKGKAALMSTLNTIFNDVFEIFMCNTVPFITASYQV